MRRTSVFAAFLVLAVHGGAAAQDAAREPPARRPRLVVVLSVDQLRADYLTRFEDLFLPPRSEGKPGGFRWLMEEGAWFSDAWHDHFPTVTGSGHAVLLTGAPPGVNGVVGNIWYDRAAKRVRYCLDGTSARAGSGESPEQLLATTLGGELEIATGGRARTWTLGQKDRAAVLLAGHVADGAAWFDDDRGAWTTSAWYGGDDKLPAWLRAWNDRKLPDADFGASWAPCVPETAFERCWVPPGDPPAVPFAVTLERGKPLSRGGSAQEAKAFYRTWGQTPFAIDWVMRSALACVEGAELGRDDVPDLLALNVSTLDYVGHGTGPDSALVLDAVVRMDRALAEFLRGVERVVPGGLASTVVVVTGDHGVAPNPQKARRAGFPAGAHPEADARIGNSPQKDAVEKALDAAFGADDWTLAHVEDAIYLDWTAYARRGVTAAQAERAAVAALERMPGVHACYTRSQIVEGRLPQTPDARAVTLGFHRRNSGDVVIVAEPFWSPDRGPQSTTHGSPWSYDARVPLLFGGGGVAVRRVRARVSTLDLAPTLADLLGIAQPSGSTGRVLDLR